MAAKTPAHSKAAGIPGAGGPTACLCWQMVFRLGISGGNPLAKSPRPISTTGRAPRGTLLHRSDAESSRPMREKFLHRLDTQSSRRLREKFVHRYAFGEALGKGAFGSVYRCKQKRTSENFAVKMISKEETPLPEIMREADMQKQLAHPCVAKLHDLYSEKLFVCIVLELYEGGNMVDCMQRHWKSKGAIAIPAVQNVTKMMAQSVAWLHQNGCVHRDVKGDNFLCDRKNIDDPAFRVYLTDFGTVVELRPRQRLTQRCGTQGYWAPEFYSLDYSLAVDVWALGVVTFGLVTGQAPFDSEEECRSKPLKCPSSVTQDGSDFILAALTRSESRRLTAQQAVEHNFLSSIKSAAEVAVEARWGHMLKSLSW